jgi:hypothetical protein
MFGFHSYATFSVSIQHEESKKMKLSARHNRKYTTYFSHQHLIRCHHSLCIVLALHFLLILIRLAETYVSSGVFIDCRQSVDLWLYLILRLPIHSRNHLVLHNICWPHASTEFQFVLPQHLNIWRDCSFRFRKQKEDLRFAVVDVWKGVVTKVQNWLHYKKFFWTRTLW